MAKQQKYPISYLLLKVRFGTASEEEKRQVETWLKAGKGREDLYKRVAGGVSLQEHLKLTSDFEQATDYAKMEAEIRAKLKRRRQHRDVFRYVSWIGTAAACLAGVVFLLYEQPKTEPVSVLPVTQDISNRFVDDKVVLVLDDGQQIAMGDCLQDSIRLDAAIVIAGQDQLVYDTSDSLNVESNRLLPEINKIITTTGGFFSIVLGDGSKIWLNSESELEYPVFFAGHERRVKLSGEAYFEIAPDKEHPFIVETSGIRTKVLGTSFNINAYKDENTINTTLFTGKVDVAPLNDTASRVILSPGKQASWNSESQSLEVQEADLKRVLAWKDGMFAFHQENIKVVTRQIERWYGVKFIYPLDSQNEQYTFSGRFSKDEKLETILQELTFIGGPKFTVEDNNVYIEYVK